VADSVPPAIYTIPPGSPLFRDRYVYIYGCTPDYVYLGYTPGYLGAYVWDDVVVFGTGWWYPAWYGDLYFGWPWTWGFGLEFGYWGGGWFWRPPGRPWWFYNPPYLHRVFADHWNTNWNARDREPLRYDANVYNRLPENAVSRPAAHITAQPVRPPATGNRGDFYADHGTVYQYRQNNWYRQDDSGQWQRTPSNPSLEMQRQSRSLGTSRQNEFQQRGFSPGVPSTRTPSFGGGAVGGGRRR
jgi:hypothetical protein